MALYVIGLYFPEGRPRTLYIRRMVCQTDLKFCLKYVCDGEGIDTIFGSYGLWGSFTKTTIAAAESESRADPATAALVAVTSRPCH